MSAQLLKTVFFAQISFKHISPIGLMHIARYASERTH